MIVIYYFFPKIDMWGAFAGAGFAFILNYQHEKQRTIHENCQTLIKEQYKLRIFLNELTQIKQHIEKCKMEALENKEKRNVVDEEWRFIEWRFIKPFFNSPTLSHFNSKVNLDFMLENFKGQECLDAILLANDQYEQSLYFLKKRNQLYETYLAKAENIEEQDLLSLTKLNNLIGPKIIGQNFEWTKTLLEKLPNYIEDIRNAFIKTGDFINTTWNKEPLTLKAPQPDSYKIH